MRASEKIWDDKMKQLSERAIREVYRYLGYQKEKHQLTPDMEQLIDDGIQEVLDKADPRVVLSDALPLEHNEQGFGIGRLTLSGSDIREHLKNCQQIVLMGATLGTAVDQLIRRTEILDMAKAVILDAAANVVIEEVCEKAEETLRQQMSQDRKYTTIRYSPGYGDLPIETQNEILRMLDAPRKIGLSVTPTHIMTPRKSITSIMGIADIPVQGKKAGCGHCVLRGTCIYRKRGTVCD